MTLITLPLVKQARSWRLEVTARWEALSVRTQTQCKALFLCVFVVAAYHYSLESLLQTVGFDTPLAYVGLVPFLAAGLAWLRRRPAVAEPPIHDRQLDYIIGVPLIFLAALMDFVLPRHLGAMYWVNRIDLLSLPIFVAGLVTLLFGTRVLWRQKVAILYLFLAWPWPYTNILLGTLGGFTTLTLDGLNAALKVLPVASPVPGAYNAGLYEVSHAGHAFPVSVVTACSGVDGMVGFFLVGSGFATIVKGPVVRKLLWLAAGLVLLWSTNLARLLGIFWLGQRLGEHIAIGIIHPVAGIVIFCVGVVAMMMLLRPFGLQFVDFNAPVKGSATLGASVAAPKRAVPRVFLSAGIIGLVGIVLAVNNSSLVNYDPVASAAGEPKLGSYLADPASPVGWVATYDTEYTINKPLFGQSSRWLRYLYTETTGQKDLSSSVPITADVIDAGGLSGFEQYGVTACYSFHGYTLRDVASISLGSGITGQALSWSSSDNGNWSIVYWIWPVKTSTGTRYERVILYLQNTANAVVKAPAHVPGVKGLTGALEMSNSTDRQLIVNREFLVTFARDIVQGQIHKTDTDINISTFSPSFSQTFNPTAQQRQAIAARNRVDNQKRISASGNGN
jgi:exosortase/archaeosortase family protein